ncbi:uncharacterized protein LOC110465561 [Mizuhopecten yessoensis]|uniref:uncharacterized protein LOC110465561 n=1 Tax=Mizuhopecten yessoensis TaxID=6573 RepID=UPI000B4581F7|nr:uncharacterized protein LOC110465561 [Mizuhopecten yessoensis]
MAATILEEVLGDARDCKKDVFAIYLDAKSAFDVVNHNSLLRKLFLAGVDGKSWKVIQDLHFRTTSCVKWDGQLSDSFQILQGVRQGGLLSTELYKVYVNDLLNCIQSTGLGIKIGTNDCSAPTCADDVTILAHELSSLQTLLDVAVDYSSMERYILQPEKSTVLMVPSSSRLRSQIRNTIFRIGPDPVNIRTRTTHLRIQQDVKSTAAATVETIYKKKPCVGYSLMRSGLHGGNGLDPITAITGYCVCAPQSPLWAGNLSPKRTTIEET